MNEVEKMYKKVGVEPEYDYFTAIKYPKIVQYFHLNKKELVDIIVDKIKYCKKNILIKVIRVDKDYPDFTAEKQLSLIKWLCKNKSYTMLIKYINSMSSWRMECNFNGVILEGSFEETLAGLINNLWNNLTAQERTEIRGILEN